MIFKEVRDGRPYPNHGFSTKDWARIPPRQVRLDELVTTKRELALDKLLDEDSTFYGDLFPHAVQWRGDLYLEDGLHRALRAALQQRHVLHVRVLNLDERTDAAERGEPADRDVEPDARRWPSTPAAVDTADDTGDADERTETD